MWMTEYVREVKRQLRDVYGLTPSRTVGEEPCFENVQDGIYPMEVIPGKKEWVVVSQGKFIFCLEMKSPREEDATG
jgi:hypothetical protein